MSRIRVINVVGARPNFMKIAPIIKAMRRRADVFDDLLVHTGQHYDERMSRAFFEDLGIPRPDIDLGVGSGTHAEQTGRVMIAFEQVCIEHRPDLVIVVGDVNSTLACAVTAKKLGVAVAHVEAGLRSRDMTMPEEINRLCTDAVSDYLFTTDEGADENLRREGVGEERIVFVGNVMIDTLLRHRELAARRPGVCSLPDGTYAVLTLHRPSNVDDAVTLEGILDAVSQIGRQVPVVFPVHPRTRERIESFGLGAYFEDGSRVRLLEPLGYLEFLRLLLGARLVLTDSGGLQEETTVLGIPCLTLRFNTERPITCSAGTNVLVGNRTADILAAAERILQGESRPSRIPDKWDGRAAERIVEWLANRFADHATRQVGTGG